MPPRRTVAYVYFSIYLTALMTGVAVSVTYMTQFTLYQTSMNHSDAVKTCSNAGQKLLDLDTHRKRKIFKHMFPTGIDQLWTGAVYDESSSVCNEKGYLWSNCVAINGMNWTKEQPRNCVNNNCTIITDAYELSSEGCNALHTFVCESITGPCTFQTKEISLNKLAGSTVKLEGLSEVECQDLCLNTQFSGSRKECWAYNINQSFCFLYFGFYQMESMLLQIEIDENSVSTIRAMTCAEQHQTTELPTVGTTNAENVAVPCPPNADTSGSEESCTFLDFSTSLNGNLNTQINYALVVSNSKLDECLSRCRKSSIDDLQCQAVLEGFTATTCILYYGTTRLPLPGDYKIFNDLKLHVRYCDDQSTRSLSSTTTATTTTATMSTTTRTSTTTMSTTTQTSTTNTQQPETINTGTPSPSETQNLTTTEPETTTKTGTSTLVARTTDDNENPTSTTSPRPKDEFGLIVPKTTLSSFKIKYISVYESRPSAVSIGVLGGILIVSFLVLIVLSDTNIIWIHVTTIGIRNIRMGLSSKVASEKKPEKKDDDETPTASSA